MGCNGAVGRGGGGGGAGGSGGLICDAKAPTAGFPTGITDCEKDALGGVCAWANEGGGGGGGG